MLARIKGLHQRVGSLNQGLETYPNREKYDANTLKLRNAFRRNYVDNWCKSEIPFRRNSTTSINTRRSHVI